MKRAGRAEGPSTQGMPEKQPGQAARAEGRRFWGKTGARAFACPGKKRQAPLRGLRLRLTAVCTLLTTLVLAAALWAGWWMARGQKLADADALLAGSLAGLLEKLETAGSVSDRFLTELELQNQAMVYLLDNGQPLQFAGAWQTGTPREVLAERALEAAGGEGIRYNVVSGRRLQIMVALQGEGGEEYTGYLARPAAPEGVLVLLLQSTAVHRPALAALARQYLMLGLGGACALALTAWLLAGAAIRPTAHSFARQREFVAAASHELRTPLAAVDASLAAAELTLPARPAEAGQLLRTAQRETGRMARLVDDLLLLANSDAAAWQLRPERVGLDEVCRQAYEQFLPLARAAGRRLCLLLEEPEAEASGTAAPAAPEVWGDEERLVQLLGVLLANALEYAPPGSTVELALRCRGRSASVLVRDHGPGIPDGEKQRVFERFYRAEQSRTDHAHFGLGLAVAWELARLHGGRLSVRDTLDEEGRTDGATFVLELKLL